MPDEHSMPRPQVQWHNIERPPNSRLLAEDFPFFYHVATRPFLFPRRISGLLKQCEGKQRLSSHNIHFQLPEPPSGDLLRSLLPCDYVKFLRDTIDGPLPMYRFERQRVPEPNRSSQRSLDKWIDIRSVDALKYKVHFARLTCPPVYFIPFMISDTVKVVVRSFGMVIFGAHIVWLLVWANKRFDTNLH